VGCANLPEPDRLAVSINYKVTWERNNINLAELARLRWVERWQIARIADHFEVCGSAVSQALRRIEAKPALVGPDSPLVEKIPQFARRIFKGR
jgi:hypothetical protein